MSEEVNKELEYLQCKYDSGNQTSPSSLRICNDKAEMSKLSMMSLFAIS